MVSWTVRYNRSDMSFQPPPSHIPHFFWQVTFVKIARQGWWKFKVISALNRDLNLRTLITRCPVKCLLCCNPEQSISLSWNIRFEFYHIIRNGEQTALRRWHKPYKSIKIHSTELKIEIRCPQWSLYLSEFWTREYKAQHTNSSKSIQLNSELKFDAHDEVYICLNPGRRTERLNTVKIILSWMQPNLLGISFQYSSTYICGQRNSQLF